MGLNFWRKTQEKPAIEQTIVQLKPKVVVVSFEDQRAENTGLILCQFLKQNLAIDFEYYEDLSSKSFLNLQQGSFFDLIDYGNEILKKTNADILLWGYRQGGELRLNFQKKHHYERPNIPFFSLLNSLYLPMEYFVQKQIPQSILWLIYGVVFSLCFDQENLDKVVDELSRSALPQGLSEKQLPSVLNILSAVYLRACACSMRQSDVELIMQFLKKSYKLAYSYQDKPAMGCVYAQFGQVYSLLANNGLCKKFDCLRKAIESLRYARKHFNRYNFPYDFGFQSYHLSMCYFEYWRQSNDVQALRDAVFYLRECEKIFTFVTFSKFWADIQKDLGYYLSLLGSFGKNDDILMLAVDNYRNRQKVYSKEDYPLDWAKSEESVGNILYSIGKMHANEEYLMESVKAFGKAADVYENENNVEALRQMRVCQMKSEEEIMRLKNK